MTEVSVQHLIIGCAAFVTVWSLFGPLFPLLVLGLWVYFFHLLAGDKVRDLTLVNR